MKKLGWALIILAILGIAAALGMDTSVNIPGSVQRVNNIGLMRDQQNVLMLFVGLLVVGAIFAVLGRRSADQSSDSKELRPCPHCAEKIQMRAVVCRYCGRDVPAMAIPTPAQSNTKARVESVVRTSSTVAAAAATTVGQQISKSRIPFKKIGLSVGALLLGVVAVGWVMELMSKHHAAEVQIENLTDALKLYKFDNGGYPSDAQGLQALASKPTAEPVPANWKHYLDSVPVDPWGHPFLYRNPGPSGYLEVISLGEDGQLGGEGKAADIQKWVH